MTSYPLSMRFVPLFGVLAASMLLAACGRADGDVPETTSDTDLLPPAAAFLGEDGAVGVEARLAAIDADLAAVLEQGLDDEMQVVVLRAEAMTDRLLEDEPPAAWLASGYYVEARLRQIQALADRVVAEVRRGVARELVLEDIVALRTSVQDLRTRLAAAGNGPAPPTLDSLLSVPENAARSQLVTRSADTTTAEPAAEPAAAPGGVQPGGLLGEPVQP